MLCLACKYDLRKLTPSGAGGEHRCPECGREFDPKDPRTFDSGDWRLSPKARKGLRYAVIAHLVLMIWLAFVNSTSPWIIVLWFSTIMLLVISIAATVGHSFVTWRLQQRH